MNTDSEFVFSGRGNESLREAENLKEEYVPTEIHVRSGSKVIRKMREESVANELIVPDSRNQS